MRYTLLELIPLLALWSCGSDAESGIADSSGDPEQELTCDKDSLTEIIPELPTDSVLTHSIISCDEAMEFMINSPDSTRYLHGVLPRIAKDCPEYAEKLLQSRYRHFIIVDKPSMFVVLYDRCGTEIDRYKMNCSRHYGSKHKRRDNRTPEGFFTAEGIYDSTDWLYTDDDGYTSPVKGQFGPRFIRLNTPVTSQVGIHGTCSPWTLGRRGSHGCIRIHNDNIIKLIEYVEPGTPVIVNPSPRDKAVNEDEGHDIPMIDIGIVRLRRHTMPAPDTTIIVQPDTAVADTVAISALPTMPTSSDTLNSTGIYPDSMAIPDVPNIKTPAQHE